ncbi:MAG: 2-oxopent-4-enoate hydratase, partial [Anaerovoracaceae bacterium]|nr:2-oxopent-4-enoate hydratase [Anaerovoracaceae bacterium]
MNEETRLEIARRLREAELNRETFPAFSTDYPDMNQDDAYDIQLKMMQYRFDAGEKLAGVKIGLTSVGMQRLVNVDTPDYGLLTDKMLILEGQPCPADELIQPKVEGEFAFILKEDLDKEYVTVADVFNATSYIAPAIEIVDSRITDWKIHYYDTVSDNGSSARFVVGGGMMKPEDVDMRTTGMTIEKNGALVSSGASAEVFGN